MHDAIHAAIAKQRVRELVESAEVRSAARRSQMPREKTRAPQRPSIARGNHIAALLRLRPWLR